MKTKEKRGKKMRLGPKWQLTYKNSKGEKERFTGTLRANIHIGKGKMIAVFAMRKRETR